VIFQNCFQALSVRCHHMVMRVLLIFQGSCTDIFRAVRTSFLYFSNMDDATGFR
jgi:hypothetical protein